MRYTLAPIFCRPWLLNGFSLKLIESHYENNYGGAMRRLNAITERLESLDFAATPGFVLNSLKRYVNTFMRNVDWKSVEVRYEDAAKVEPPRPLVQPEFGDLPGVGPEEVKAMMDSGYKVQIVDVRPRHYVSRTQDIMDGAVWRDPERIQDWIGELSKSEPVVAFCVYGFHVGCRTTVALREAGFDARFMKGGHSAWKAIGGATKMNT